ncbi:hypothetical protein GYMLUDRAFT_57771 [Collybiopsis luxurians FD-317 M1]|uniref:Uncharacterized protein n=1 Tax=Collybiopsis luxurians FD-317 M1 TaxID=944289 RepID=A0A0D0BGL6_9AGAR|nr:hypothetical protein GYMLUDRAFT_57771 [Collybiopsis luxurians FD-317 M1]
MPKPISGLSANYTIASSPAFSSLASAFDYLSPPVATTSSLSTSHLQSLASDRNPFNLNPSSLTQWSTPSSTRHDAGTLDDLFGSGGLLNPQWSMDAGAFTMGDLPSALSPFMHHTNNSGSPGTSGSSTPASHTSNSLFSDWEWSSAESETSYDDSEHPKTREDLYIGTSSSFFSSEKSGLTSISIEGETTFPQVKKSDWNIPLLYAWRNITRDPQFKARTFQLILIPCKPDYVSRNAI